MKITIEIRGPQGAGKSVLARDIAAYLQDKVLVADAVPNGVEIPATSMHVVTVQE